jgi:hypothetical protein
VAVAVPEAPPFRRIPLEWPTRPAPMHLPPEVWGPIFWSTFHITSLAYPDQPTYAEKRAAKEFFGALVHLLPCPVCRDHFREVFQGMPVDSWLDNRGSLTEWVWSVHNQVNRRLGKREISMSEFHEAYRAMAERGLPIPPASPTAEISDAALTAATVRGATAATGIIAALAVVGGLLWVSYR